MAWLSAFHPYAEIGRNYSEISNEFIIIAILDILLVSSVPAVDANSRGLLGYSIIAILGLSILNS